MEPLLGRKRSGSSTEGMKSHPPSLIISKRKPGGVPKISAHHEKGRGARGACPSHPSWWCSKKFFWISKTRLEFQSVAVKCCSRFSSFFSLKFVLKRKQFHHLLGSFLVTVLQMLLLKMSIFIIFNKSCFAYWHHLRENYFLWDKNWGCPHGLTWHSQHENHIRHSILLAFFI